MNTSKSNIKGKIKMKTKYLKFIVLIGVIFNLQSLIDNRAYAQYFLSAYDIPPTSSRFNIGRSIVRSFSPKRFTIAGFSGYRGAGIGYDWMFLRLDTLGNVLGTTLYGTPSFGATYNDYCYSHVQLSESKRPSILAGHFRDITNTEKASIIKVDSSGIFMSGKQITCQSSYRQVINYSEQLIYFPIGEVVLAGYGVYAGLGITKKVLVTKYDISGTALTWAKLFLTFDEQVHEAFSICRQRYGGVSYGVAGNTNNFSSSPTKFDVFVMKLSAAGDELWTKVYRPDIIRECNSHGNRIIPLKDSGFVVIGWTNMNDSTRSDILLLRINSEGDVIWSNTYGNQGVYERGYSVVQPKSDTSSLVFTGLVNDEKIVLGKVNKTTGELIWSNKYDSYDGIGYDIIEDTKTNGYSLTGYIDTSSSVYNDPFLMRANSTGDVTGGCLVSASLERRSALMDIRDLDFIVSPQSDIDIQPTATYVIPTEVNLCEDGDNITGVSGNGAELPIRYELRQNYPNPFNPNTVISYQLPVNGFVTLKIYDLLGREIATLVNEELKAGTYEIEWNASNYPSGVYFYKLQSSSFEDTKKMVLIK